jgi:hypothetical protein
MKSKGEYFESATLIAGNGKLLEEQSLYLIVRPQHIPRIVALRLLTRR